MVPRLATARFDAAFVGPIEPARCGDLRAGNRFNESGWRDSEGIQNLKKLDDIQPTLPTLVLRDEGLRTPETLSELRLGQSSGLPCFNKKDTEPLMFGRKNRFARQASLAESVQ